MDRAGRLDVLVNNAGAGLIGAWDLRLYLVCPQPDPMGTDPGRRCFQGRWYIDLPNINLNNEDRGAGEAADGPVHG